MHQGNRRNTHPATTHARERTYQGRWGPSAEGPGAITCGRSRARAIALGSKAGVPMGRGPILRPGGFWRGPDWLRPGCVACNVLPRSANGRRANIRMLGACEATHNPKVVGSNPTPATKKPPRFHGLGASLSLTNGIRGSISPGTPRKALALEPGRVKYRQSAVGNLLLAHGLLRDSDGLTTFLCHPGIALAAVHFFPRPW